MIELLKIKTLLSSNYFVLFELDISFDIDQSDLYKKYLNLQKQFHPDQFVSSDKELKSLVISLSAHINSGYTTLKDPLLRSILLLELNKVVLNLVNETNLPTSFLLEQIELHEAIEDVKATKNILLLENLEAQLNKKELDITDKIAQLFRSGNLEEVKELVKQLSFYNRLHNTINLAFEHI